MVMGREDVPSASRLMMISDENENQFYQFLIFLIDYYLIDPDFIILYRKTNFEILTNFSRRSFLKPTPTITCKIAKFCSFAII